MSAGSNLKRSKKTMACRGENDCRWCLRRLLVLIAGGWSKPVDYEWNILDVITCAGSLGVSIPRSLRGCKRGSD